MYRFQFARYLTPVFIAVALSTTAGALADYQQTLAALGADAYAAPITSVEIDNQSLAETFAENIVEANPALSDQEVMVDLHARMMAEQRLEIAAAALDPTTVSPAVTTAPAQTATQDEDSAISVDETGVTQASDPETTPAAVASR